MIENIDVTQMLNDYAIPWGIDISLAIIIFIVGRLVVRLVVSVARKLLVRAELDDILINFLSSIM